MKDRIWRNILIVAAIMAMLPFPGNADDPLVSGILISPEGVPAAGVPVVVHGDQVSDFTLTDEKGSFSFDRLPAGRYTVRPVNTPDISHEFTIREANPGLLGFLLGSELESINGNGISLGIETNRQ